MNLALLLLLFSQGNMGKSVGTQRINRQTRDNDCGCEKERKIEDDCDCDCNRNVRDELRENSRNDCGCDNRNDGGQRTFSRFGNSDRDGYKRNECDCRQ